MIFANINQTQNEKPVKNKTGQNRQEVTENIKSLINEKNDEDYSDVNSSIVSNKIHDDSKSLSDIRNNDIKSQNSSSDLNRFLKKLELSSSSASSKIRHQKEIEIKNTSISSALNKVFNSNFIYKDQSDADSNDDFNPFEENKNGGGKVFNINNSKSINNSLDYSTYILSKNQKLIDKYQNSLKDNNNNLQNKKKYLEEEKRDIYNLAKLNSKSSLENPLESSNKLINNNLGNLDSNSIKLMTLTQNTPIETKQKTSKNEKIEKPQNTISSNNNINLNPYSSFNHIQMNLNNLSNSPNLIPNQNYYNNNYNQFNQGYINNNNYNNFVNPYTNNSQQIPMINQFQNLPINNINRFTPPIQNIKYQPQQYIPINQMYPYKPQMNYNQYAQFPINQVNPNLYYNYMMQQQALTNIINPINYPQYMKSNQMENINNMNNENENIVDSKIKQTLANLSINHSLEEDLSSSICDENDENQSKNLHEKLIEKNEKIVEKEKFINSIKPTKIEKKILPEKNKQFEFVLKESKDQHNQQIQKANNKPEFKSQIYQNNQTNEFQEINKSNDKIENQIKNNNNNISKKNAKKIVDILENKPVDLREPKYNDDLISKIKGSVTCKQYQKSLELMNPKDVNDIIFPKLIGNIYSLCTDSLGNYFMLKILDYLSPYSLNLFYKEIFIDLIGLSCSLYSSRIIQKLIDFLENNIKIEVFTLIVTNFNNLIKDSNGLHVVLKTIKEIILLEEKYSQTYYIKHISKGNPILSSSYIFSIIIDNLKEFSFDKYGCCFIQKCLYVVNKETQKQIIDKVMLNINSYLTHSYGNYVLQEILSLERNELSEVILFEVSKDFLGFSNSKSTSNVIEKLIKHYQEKTMALIYKEIDSNTNFISQIIVNSYGNYVYSCILEASTGDRYDHFISELLINISKILSKPFGPCFIKKLSETHKKIEDKIDINLINQIIKINPKQKKQEEEENLTPEEIKKQKILKQKKKRMKYVDYSQK